MAETRDTATRVLIVEDNPGDARLTCEMLVDAGWWGDVIRHAADLASADAMLAEGGTDVVLLDLTLPDADGMQGLGHLQDAYPMLPIVVLSGHDDEARALQAVQEGAQDYLVKGEISADAVRRAVRYAVERKRLTCRLLDAKQRAEDASRAKSEFLTTMSHELRTPLNAIIGFAEVLETEPKGPLGHPSYREYARDVRESGQHLLALINSILDLARIEAGRMQLHEEPVDLREVAAGVVRVLANEASKAGVDLSAAVPEGLPPVYADARLMRQIFFNLMANALKFSEPDGTVRASAERDAEGGLVVRVEDTGIGIEPDQLERILEPFVQARGDLGRRYQGTGLGLSIVKSLVEMHDGTLAIDSVPGEGTTVELLLPEHRILAEASSTQVQRMASP